MFSLKSLLGNTFWRASMWTAAGFVMGQFLRLLSNLILTRLVEPDAFGLMAIVTVVIIGVEMTTDLGLNTSIIQNRRGEEADFVNTAWTLRIVRSLFMAAIVAVMAMPLANFYAEPQLAALLPIVAVMIIVSGLGSNALAVAERRLWLGRSTSISLAGQLASTLVAAAWALKWPSVWALVAGYTASVVVISVLSHLAFPGFKSRLGWSWSAASEIVSFGKWIFLTSILIFAAGQIDRIVLAKLVPLSALGLYSIAFMWAQLPATAAQTWCGKMILPIASSELRAEAPDRRKLINHRRYFLIAVVAAVVTLSLGFDAVFRILYTPEYWPAIALFRILLTGALVRVLDESYRVFNLAAGTPHYTSLGNIITIAIFLAIVIPLFHQFGATGVALSYAISQAGTFFVSAYGARRHGVSDIFFDLCAIGVLAVFTFISFEVMSTG